MSCELDPRTDARLDAMLERASAFFGRDVRGAAHALASRLDAVGIPYAFVDTNGLAAHGHVRATQELHVLLSTQGFSELQRGYGRLGGRRLRDAERDVMIDVSLAGDFPGDGAPKPVAFPDPARVAERGQRFAVLPLARLIELKLASGMTAAHRLKDLADVLELIRARQLPRDLALDPYVRAKYDELWLAAQGSDPHE
jgi:hypothetical protein